MMLWQGCGWAGQSLGVQVTDDGQGVAIEPALADAIRALNDGECWAYATDDRWRLVAMTNALSGLLPVLPPAGVFYYGPEAVEVILRGPVGNSVEQYREEFRQLGQWVLDDFGADRDRLRDLLHPVLRDVLDEVISSDSDVRAWEMPNTHLGGKLNVYSIAQRVRDPTGRVVGSTHTTRPAVGTTTVAMLAASADLDHLRWMQHFSIVARRPAAVLFADLEGSAQLSKRLPTAAYFRLVRRLTKAADECVIEAGGLVGRHVGDGVVAFFPAEIAGSEPAAARACIGAARALQASTVRIAERHDLPPEEVTVRAGLHWGATLHIGSIITVGRTEVTALGDEVNEAARIEACATGGRVLASKNLIERLDDSDAKSLGVDLSRITYTQLTDLDTATEKARRDAPAIPVCDLA